MATAERDERLHVAEHSLVPRVRGRAPGFGGLVRSCDVYITNHPLPMRRMLKLNYEDLKPFNERMIYASLTAYGEEGPDRDREGFDLVAYWARSGLMDLVRSGDAQPAQAS